MFAPFLYQFVLNTTAFSSLVLIVALALGFLFRKSAATVFACGFGGLVVAFLVPLLCLLGNSINQHHLAIPVDTAFFSDAKFRQPPQYLVRGDGSSQASSTGRDNDEFDRNESKAESPVSAQFTTSPASSQRFNPRLFFDIAILTYCAVTIIFLLRLCGALIGVKRIYKKSDLIIDTSHPKLRRLISQLGQDRVSLRSCKSLKSPIAMQWPQRAILVPAEFLSTTSFATIDRVIEHERAHILRHDQVTLLIQEIIASVFWFHPFVHLLKRMVDRAREDVCDNWVLAKSDSAAFCRDLVALSQGSTKVQLLALGFIHSRNIRSRVRSLLNETRVIEVSLPKRIKARIGILLLAVGSLAFFAGFGITQDNGAEQTPAQISTEELQELMQNFSNPQHITAAVYDRETGDPIAGAKVVLLHVNPLAHEQETLGTTETNMAGEFEFHNLDQTGKPDLNLVVLISHEGHSSQIHGLRNSLSYLQHRNDWRISLGKAAILRGRITDINGNPIAGVDVWQPMFLTEPVAGVLHDQTDADGRYEIRDHHDFRPHKVRDLGNGVSEGVSGTLMMVRHPEYGRKFITVKKIPGNVDLQLEKKFAVKGRVIDKATGKPLAGLTVHASGHDHHMFDNTKTDSNGRFEFALSPTTKFNVWVRHPSLEAAAQVVEGMSDQTVATKDFELESLVTVKGVVIDDTTGQPFQSDSKEQFVIHWYGDARPDSTGECKSAPIKKDGTFELKVLPGRIAPYIGNYSLIDVGGRTYKEGVVVSRDKPVELKFRVREREDMP